MSVNSFGWQSKGGGGGSVADGVLQLQNGVAMDTTLRPVTDQANTASPLQLSTTQVKVSGTGSFLVGDFTFTPNYNIGGYAQWSSTSANLYHEWAISSNTDRYLFGLEASGVGFVMYHSTAVSEYIASFGTAKIYFNKNVLIGNYGGSASARLHVRGDGSNPIARFEDNAGTPMLRIENSLMRFGASTPFGSLQFAMTGTTISSNNNGTGLGFYSQFSVAGGSDRYDFAFGGDAVANDAGSVTHFALVRNFAAGAGAANFRPIGIYYTINNSGAQSGTAAGIYSRATETNLNGMAHNLIDLGTVGLGGLFSVTNKGAIKVATIADADAPNSSLYYSSTASKLVWKDSGGVVNNLY